MSPKSFSVGSESYTLRLPEEKDIEDVRSIFCQKMPDTYPYQDLEIYEENCSNCSSCKDFFGNCGSCQAKKLCSPSNQGFYAFVICSADSNSAQGFIEIRSYYPTVKNILSYYHPISSFFKNYSPSSLKDNYDVVQNRDDALKAINRLYSEDLEKKTSFLNIIGTDDKTIKEMINYFEKAHPHHNLTEIDLQNFMEYIFVYEAPEDLKSSSLLSSHDIAGYNKYLHQLYDFNEQDKIYFSEETKSFYELTIKHQGFIFGDVAWYMNANHLCQGLGTKALGEVAAFLFENTAIVCLSAHSIADGNIPSYKGIQKLGFKKIGSYTSYRDKPTVGHPGGGFSEEVSEFILEKDQLGK